MNKLLAATSALALTTFASQSHADSAQRWPNWYVGVSGAATFLQSSDLKTTGATNRTTFDDGSEETVSLGYMPSSAMWPFSNLRIEAEGGYHYNTINGIGGVAAPGSVRIWSYMGNLYYDFRNSSQWTPYVGAGAGDANVGISKTTGVNGSSDSVFAYQFLAGISYAPTSIPQTEWDLGYRYFTATSPTFGSVKLDDIRTNEAEIGAKFRF